MAGNGQKPTKQGQYAPSNAPVQKSQPARPLKDAK